jgi:hypothetical protein
MVLSIQVSALLIGFASLQTTIAAPVTEARPILGVFPGPSLPSLESLGWNATYINSLPDPVLRQSGMSVLEQRFLICLSNTA